MYHRKIVGCEQFLKSCRKRNTDTVESKTRITLSIQVHTHIYEKHYLGLADTNAKLVYVALRDHGGHYDAARDDSSLKICLQKMLMRTDCKQSDISDAFLHYTIVNSREQFEL